MNIINWVTSRFEEKHTLLEALSLRIPSAPQAFLRQLCKKQRVLLDGQVVAAEMPVLSGQGISIKSSQRLDEILAAAPLLPQAILFEDKSCLVVNKSAGLLTHPDQNCDDSLLTRLQAFSRLRGEKFQLAPIHRLDVGTSGPVLFGKGKAATSQLGKALMGNWLQKSYLALVSGVTPEQGELLSKVPAKGKEKESRTLYRRIDCTDAHTLLRLRLITGRQHQIRRQLTDAGWPIVGDSRYGGEARNGLEHPFLHCEQLSFPSLEAQEEIQVFCALPTQLEAQLAERGLAVPARNQAR
ncbi:MAG: RluA family pseudouridine synthase [Desulfuromonadales bacterium]|nr:RluA family pseudouridine synthase [Desulfuromonadales bacterium]